MKSIRSNPLARINQPRRGNGLDAAVDGRIDLAAAERVEHELAAARRDRMFAAAERVAAVGCWEADAFDAPAVWSRGMYHLLDVPLSSTPLSHDDLAALVASEDRDGLLAAVGRAGPGEGWDCEARIVTAEGYERVLRLQGRVAPVGRDDPGTGRRPGTGPLGPPRLSGVITDVTHIRRAARDEEERFRLTFDDAPVGLALVDARAAGGPAFVQVNRALGRILGRPRAGLVGQPLAAVTHPDDAPAIRTVLGELVAGTVTAHRDEARCRHADGRELCVLVNAWATRAAPGDRARSARHVVLHVEDITDRRHAELELSHRALHDGLTGLPNRALLLDHLTGALARAERQGTHVAVMFLDLDHFKEVNDTLGHDAGDRLLVDVAGRLRRCLRETDTAARLGGDEFVVVCEGLATPEQAAISAGRIAGALRTEIPAPHHPLTVTVSVGVATSRGTSAPADLLREADAAMYRAKERGRARYEFAEATPDRALPAAVARPGDATARGSGRGRPSHYEPAVDLVTGAVRAVEARFRPGTQDGAAGTEPRRAASRARDVALPGGGALDTACRRAAGWHARLGAAAPALWLDAPVRELGRGTVVGRVAAALTSSGLPPERLSLEVPERHLVGFGPSARADLSALADLGVRLTVDDARGALAAWPHLDRIPLHAVKIDGALVAGLGTRRVDGALVRGLVSLAHGLDLRVVATGVATEGQREQLGALGCDLAQGGAVHAPVPADEVTALVTAAAEA
jgi:diguanylate cyclase (GGDEF)-like protein/PAS domain S-box-containing protein